MTHRIAAGLAAGTLASFAMAAPPPNEDPLVASFERMLRHTPAPAAAPAAYAPLERRLGEDPLRKAVAAVLWRQEPELFHVGARFALSTAPATHVPSRAH
jgi:hypothetical protein